MSPIDRDKWKNDLAKYKEELRRLRYLSAYTSGTRWGQFTWLEYRADHDFLLRLGKSKPPKSELGETTDISVTDFSKWVFSLYRPTVDRKSLETGKEVERAIAARISDPKLSGYERVYDDPLNCKPHPLKISCLTFKGRPMWGAPDLVLRNSSTGNIRNVSTCFGPLLVKLT